LIPLTDLRTHHIQPSITLQKGFIPQGCSDSVGDVITFGAGQQFAGIYKFAHEHNYRVVGGITGGGHSLLSNELGKYIITVICYNLLILSRTGCG
jgi:hypothetical protein